MAASEVCLVAWVMKMAPANKSAEILVKMYSNKAKTDK